MPSLLTRRLGAVVGLMSRCRDTPKRSAQRRRNAAPQPPRPAPWATDDEALRRVAEAAVREERVRRIVEHSHAIERLVEEYARTYVAACNARGRAKARR